MGAVTSWGGAWKVCPTCGKLFYVNDCEKWAYKRHVSLKGKKEIRHFCIWSCMLKFDKEYEEKKKKKRSDAAIAQHKRQKDKRRKELEGRTCGECRYCMKGRYGFYDCAVRQNAISTTKAACYRFMEKYQVEDKNGNV